VTKIVAANLAEPITEKEMIDNIIPAYEHIQTGRRNKPSAGLHCCNRLSGWESLGYRGASIGGTVKFQLRSLAGGGSSLVNTVMNEEDPLSLNFENRTFLLW
jgi:hypothetical protein